jgi:hypothetical protein
MSDAIKPAEPSLVEPNPADPVWKLYLYPQGLRAQLCCHFLNTTVIVDLPAAWARVIILLVIAREQDAGLPPHSRGARHATYLAQEYEKNQRLAQFLATSMTAYLHRLCRKISNANSGDKPLPALIARQTRVGARLLYPVEIRLVGVPPTATVDLNTLRAW